MKSKHFRWIGAALALMLVIVLSGAPLAIAQDGGPERTGLRPDAPAYGIRGPYPVGTMEFVLEDETRPLVGTMWYPALNPDGAEEVTSYILDLGAYTESIGTLPGHALKNAPPDGSGGPYPLVVFSTGSAVSRFMGPYLLEQLASYGFVVLGIEHVGNSLASSLALPPEEFNAQIPAMHILRVQDVQRQIDYAEVLTAAGGTLEGMVDINKVAVMGVSFGGYTAFAIAGAQIDFEGHEDLCANIAISGTVTPVMCALTDEQKQAMATQAGLDSVPEGLWPSMADPRVDAIVAISPYTSIFASAGMDAVAVPVLMLAGTADTWLDPQANYFQAFEYLNTASKTRVLLENADHVISGDCPPAWDAFAFPMCSDSVWDLDRAHDLIDHFVVAFLLAEFYDDPDAAAALAPDAVQFPGVIYETTEF